MTTRDKSAQNQSTEHRRELRTYLWGLALALGATLAAFTLDRWAVLERSGQLLGIGVLAIAQIAAHFRFFLHIGLSKQKREDLHLILFSTLLLLIMASGTIWIMADLSARMNAHGGM